jgi:hypothetical protein
VIQGGRLYVYNMHNIVEKYIVYCHRCTRAEPKRVASININDTCLKQLIQSMSQQTQMSETPELVASKL